MIKNFKIPRKNKGQEQKGKATQGSLQEPSTSGDIDEQMNLVRNFKIPRKEKDHQNYLEEVAFNCRDYTQDVYPIIKQNYYQRNESEKNFRYIHCYMVRNTIFSAKMEAKRRDMKASKLYADKDLIISYGFLEVRNVAEAERICKQGLKCGYRSFGCLGKPDLGVYLSRYSDVLTAAPLTSGVSGTFIVFKIIKGRIKVVPLQSGHLEPTPNFDCHIGKPPSSDLAACGNRLYEALQIYLYEYDDTELMSEIRQICPMAVLTYDYGSLSARAKDVAIWAGKMTCGEKFLVSRLMMLSQHGKMKPFGLSLELVVKKIVKYEDCLKYLPVKELFNDPNQSNMFRKREILTKNGQFVNLFRFIDDKSKEFGDFVQKLYDSKTVGISTLRGGSFLLLFPLSEFSDQIGIPRYGDTVDNLHCLLISYRSSCSSVAFVRDPYEAPNLPAAIPSTNRVNPLRMPDFCLTYRSIVLPTKTVPPVATESSSRSVPVSNKTSAHVAPLYASEKAKQIVLEETTSTTEASKCFDPQQVSASSLSLLTMARDPRIMNKIVNSNKRPLLEIPTALPHATQQEAPSPPFASHETASSITVDQLPQRHDAFARWTNRTDLTANVVVTPPHLSSDMEFSTPQSPDANSSIESCSKFVLPSAFGFANPSQQKQSESDDLSFITIEDTPSSPTGCEDVDERPQRVLPPVIMPLESVKAISSVGHLLASRKPFSWSEAAKRNLEQIEAQAAAVKLTSVEKEIISGAALRLTTLLAPPVSPTVEELGRSSVHSSSSVEDLDEDDRLVIAESTSNVSDFQKQSVAEFSSDATLKNSPSADAYYVSKISEVSKVVDFPKRQQQELRRTVAMTNPSPFVDDYIVPTVTAVEFNVQNRQQSDRNLKDSYPGNAFVIPIKNELSNLVAETLKLKEFQQQFNSGIATIKSSSHNDSFSITNFQKRQEQLNAMITKNSPPDDKVFFPKNIKTSSSEQETLKVNELQQHQEQEFSSGLILKNSPRAEDVYVLHEASTFVEKPLPVVIDLEPGDSKTVDSDGIIFFDNAAEPEDESVDNTKGILVPDDLIFLKTSPEDVERILQTFLNWKEAGRNVWCMKLHSQMVLKLAESKKNLDPHSAAHERVTNLLMLLTRFRASGIVELLARHDCDVKSRAAKDYLPCIIRLKEINEKAHCVFLSNLSPTSVVAKQFVDAGVFVMNVQVFIDHFLKRR